MHKQQSSNYKMFTSVESHFNTNPTVWNTIIPIAHAKQLLSTYIDEIKDMLSIQMIKNTGVAETKKTIRERLQNQVYALSSATYAFATFTEKPELVLRVNYTQTYFKTLRDAELQSVCTNLITNVEPFIPALEPYGITPSTVIILSDTINLFAANINKPQERIETKKEATAKIAALLKSTAKLLNTQLDPLMIGLKTTEPDFVVLYSYLRRVKKPGRTKLSLTTLVIDASSLLPIEGVRLEILKTKIKRISSTKGKNIMKNVVEGRYELKVTHKEYKEVVQEFTIIKGETTKLILKLIQTA